MSYNFALIGVGGYIAVRHLKAIKETGNNLVAALDINDSVGIIDSYFPEADFFVEFERFDRHIDKLRREGTKVDYIAICSPNYLHDAHIRFALRSGAHAICEKPLVLNPWNFDGLEEFEKETGRKVFNVLQLRLHPSIIKLREQIKNGPKDKIYDIELTYITSRGNWYHYSWKGDEQKSGGVATNIGIHFFDMLIWIFGDIRKNETNVLECNRASGCLKLEQANVRWYLSVDYDDLPEKIKKKGQRIFRRIIIDEDEIEFSDGFANLHTQTYQQIIDGRGFGLIESKKSIEVVYEIRNADPVGKTEDCHPLLK
ncbi:Gfo/Idh/MocA family oxidoreductase [Bacteroidota bacterium]